ncbi:MAG: serine--tRNA ligase [Bacteroidia bacterium]|nr:serine--tRNA ligase [Bacteroidia bacterium]
MLQISELRDNKKDIIQRLSIKNFSDTAIIDSALEIDDKRKQTQFELDNLLAESNKLAKEIGELFKSGETDKANEAKNKTTQLKEQTKELNELLNNLEIDLKEKLSNIPNPPHSSVKAGKTEEDNEIVFEQDSLPELDSSAKPHWELAKQYDIIDFDLGSKITGAGFPVFKGKGAQLQRALINFLLDSAREAGYTEIQPPVLVNEESAYGTGQLPDKEGQMYHLQEDNLYLIPTAEVPLTNLYRNDIVKESDLPIKMTGYTPCFRREAGSYGKDVKGLNRVHQFDKIEIVQIVNPDKSYEVLEEMKNYVESVVKKLELPYRILKLCGGEMSVANAMCYDFEAYSAAQKRWLEISSVSNFEAYQSYRLKLRFKGDGKPQLAHTLNGSALGLARVVATLLENNQTKDGINIPEVLRSYTGFDSI